MGLFSIFKKADILYYPGCTTYFKFPEIFELYKKIFSRLGINIIEPKGISCCGLPALETGYEQEARKLARKNFELFKENNIKKIITNCPACYKMFSQDYPEILPDWDIKVENMWRLILEKLVSKPRLIKNKIDGVATYHDACYLGRYCKAYDEPRKILELIGYNLIEMYDSKSESFCCGSCGGLLMINPELANKIAYQRLLQAKRAKVKKIIVASLDNYYLLKKNSDELDIEVLELSEVLADALGIKAREKKVSEEKIIDIEEDKKIEEELKDEEVLEEGLRGG